MLLVRIMDWWGTNVISHFKINHMRFRGRARSNCMRRIQAMLAGGVSTNEDLSNRGGSALGRAVHGVLVPKNFCLYVARIAYTI